MTGDELLRPDLRCPDDGHLLRENTAQDIPYWECRHCDGLWFMREAIEMPGRLSLPTKRRKPMVAADRRSCPVCWLELKELDVDDHVIDECPKCGGVWLDPAEFRAVRRRSARARVRRALPSLRGPRSRVGRLMQRLVDIFGLVMIEENPTIALEDPDPKSYIPKARPRRKR